jgi:hypothetical protein
VGRLVGALALMDYTARARSAHPLLISSNGYRTTRLQSARITPVCSRYPVGLPIKVGDDVVGAVGVSGSPGKDDDCSQAGIDKGPPSSSEPKSFIAVGPWCVPLWRSFASCKLILAQT